MRLTGVRNVLVLLSACCVLGSERVSATTAEAYDPPWVSELQWAAGNSDLYDVGTTGSSAYLENKFTPWWQNQVAHPIDDYDSSKIPTGSVRLDGALDIEYTIHRALPGWTVSKSPSGINNVYTFTPGSTSQQDRTARSGQNAFFDFGFHPIDTIMGDIGIEAVGNYDERYWAPVNEEHRLFKDDKNVAVTRGELKYDDKTLMVRGFEAIPNYGWVSENDVFELLPTVMDVEKYRREAGTLTPRGGEMNYKSEYGNLDVMGGSEIRYGYGASVYAKYDAPAMGSWENSMVYRDEKVPFTLNPDEHRWTVSLNSSWSLSEKATSHMGVLYQPFRKNEPYIDATEVGAGQGVDGTNFDLQQKETKTSDALGFTWRVEGHPDLFVDTAGLGYTYLGPIAGDKQQIDLDAGRSLDKAWTLSGAYIYRQPIVGPQPLLFEGTPSNMGALISTPRGPDDPFWVEWNNRKAHIGSFTLVYNPTPETWFFKYQKNILDDYNLNPEVEAPFSAAVQYRVTYYPTNTDRMIFWDEDRNVIFDPITGSGALATAYPFSSATGVARWKIDQWHIIANLSGGQALAGNGVAYAPPNTSVKPSTTFMQGGLSVDNSIWKVFWIYGQDVWGTEDFEAQLGLTYHRVYQAGLSYIFLKDFEAGFRYVGTRMADDFISLAGGNNEGAFNEYRFFLTYHFGKTISLGKKYEAQGRAVEVPPPPPPAAQPPVPVAAPAFATTQTPEGLKLTLSAQALFESGQTSLKGQARRVLDQVLDVLHAYPDNTLRISGHTDSTGSVAYNQKLSKRRADAVAHYLATKGVSRERMTVIGYGETRPVADNQTEVGRVQNRRVEIDILKK